MKKLLLTLLLPLVPLFSQGLNLESDREQLINSDDLFKSPYEINSGCIPKCRDLKEPYVSRVTDFDAESGITTCEIKDGGLDVLGFNANTFNKYCVEQTNNVVEYGSGQLASEGKNYGDLYSEVLFDYKQKTYTSFLGSMATLDPEIIDFDITDKTGILTLKDQSAIYGTNIIDYKTNPRYVAVTDAMNKANLAYYSKIFTNMNTVYSYTQNLLFIFVGMFFIGQIGYSKTLEVLEKQAVEGVAGQGKSLKAFMAPVLAVGLFFAPIPEDAGMNATIVQKMIRYMTLSSINIADRASAVGIEAYMTRLYSTVGAISSDGEKAIKESLLNAIGKLSIYSDSLVLCENRYPYVSTYQANDELAGKYEVFDVNKAGQDISYSACREIERKRVLARTEYREKLILSRGIEQAHNNNELGRKLTEINTKINDRQRELGFLAAVMLPSYATAIEEMSLILDNSVVKQAQDAQMKDLDQIAINRGNAHNNNTRVVLGNDEIGAVAGETIGLTTYFMLPGFSGLFQFFKSAKDGVIDTFTSKSPNAKGGLLKGAVSIAGDVGAFFMTKIIFDQILKYLPIVISVLVGLLAFFGYFVSLLKYYYISTFVTMFALTTGKVNKITEFLVNGLTIFLKPVLIVIFIFLALFINTLAADIFKILGTDAFNLIQNIQNEAWLSFCTGIMTALYFLVIPILYIIITWKLILSGPTYVFNMIGLNQNNADDLASDLTQRVSRYASPI